MELPQNLLAGARELTFEAWLKWDESDHYPTVFALGEPSQNLVFVMDTGNKNREAFGLQYENGSVIRPSWVGSPDPLELHQWRHVAAVASTNGMRLYLNGTLVMTNAYTGALFTNGPVQRAFLGRDVEDRNNHFRGEMDEVRFWKTARTAEQIRENIGRRLSGNEEGLVGLWNFDDPANPGRDASPGAHHGKLMGQASVTNAALPVLVSGRITDVSGKPLAGASVEVRRLNGTEYRFTASTAGEYAFTMAPADRCDLFVTTGELSAYRLGFQPSGEPRQRLDWVLTETGAPAARSGFSRRSAIRVGDSDAQSEPGPNAPLQFRPAPSSPPSSRTSRAISNSRTCRRARIRSAPKFPADARGTRRVEFSLPIPMPRRPNARG